MRGCFEYSRFDFEVLFAIARLIAGLFRCRRQGWGLAWTELNWTELNWTELNWTELNWTELNW
jgi:uncharacterized protein YjbI with pentapeptide repeats